MEPARYAFVEALRRYAANNFNSVMAKNAKVTIVEASSTKFFFAHDLIVFSC
jgi:hypothetical protein